MLFLTEHDVRRALAGGDAGAESVAVIEEVLRQQSEGTTYHHKRVTLTHPAHPGHLWHNIRLLPGMAPELGAAAVRLYSGYRGTNRSEIICLFDWADMRMTAIISDAWLHAIRTAAPYGVAAKHLARADARTVGIIGSGRYARAMVQAVRAVRPIDRIQVYSRDPSNVESFCVDMRASIEGTTDRQGIEIVACASARDAMLGADIMITATSGNKIVFEADWLVPGSLLMSLAPGEFGEDTVLRSRVYLSAPEQVLGDDPPRKPFDTLVAAGRFTAADVVADLCDVVTGKKPGRTSDHAVILYESAGLALLDVAIGQWVFARAVQQGLGTELPFGEH